MAEGHIPPYYSTQYQGPFQNPLLGYGHSMAQQMLWNNLGGRGPVQRMVEPIKAYTPYESYMVQRGMRDDLRQLQQDIASGYNYPGRVIENYMNMAGINPSSGPAAIATSIAGQLMFSPASQAMFGGDQPLGSAIMSTTLAGVQNMPLPPMPPGITSQGMDELVNAHWRRQISMQSGLVKKIMTSMTDTTTGMPTATAGYGGFAAADVLSLAQQLTASGRFGFGIDPFSNEALPNNMRGMMTELGGNGIPGLNDQRLLVLQKFGQMLGTARGAFGEKPMQELIGNVKAFAGTDLGGIDPQQVRDHLRRLSALATVLGQSVPEFMQSMSSVQGAFNKFEQQNGYSLMGGSNVSGSYMQPIAQLGVGIWRQGGSRPGQQMASIGQAAAWAMEKMGTTAGSAIQLYGYMGGLGFVNGKAGARWNEAARTQDEFVLGEEANRLARGVFGNENAGNYFVNNPRARANMIALAQAQFRRNWASSIGHPQVRRGILERIAASEGMTEDEIRAFVPQHMKDTASGIINRVGRNIMGMMQAREAIDLEQTQATRRYGENRLAISELSRGIGISGDFSNWMTDQERRDALIEASQGTSMESVVFRRMRQGDSIAEISSTLRALGGAGFDVLRTFKQAQTQSVFNQMAATSPVSRLAGVVGAYTHDYKALSPVFEKLRDSNLGVKARVQQATARLNKIIANLSPADRVVLKPHLDRIKAAALAYSDENITLTGTARSGTSAESDTRARNAADAGGANIPAQTEAEARQWEQRLITEEARRAQQGSMGDRLRKFLLNPGGMSLEGFAGVIGVDTEALKEGRVGGASSLSILEKAATRLSTDATLSHAARARALKISTALKNKSAVDKLKAARSTINTIQDESSAETDAGTATTGIARTPLKVQLVEGTTLMLQDAKGHEQAAKVTNSYSKK